MDLLSCLEKAVGKIITRNSEYIVCTAVMLRNVENVCPVTFWFGFTLWKTVKEKYDSCCFICTIKHLDIMNEKC